MLDKPATIKEIASILKISISTVSRALHNHPSIGITTRLKVQKLASEMKYEPNQTAIFFQKGKTYRIGVILPELSEAFFASAVSAIEDTAYKRNYTVLMAQSHDSEQKEKQLVEQMKNQRVDGLLVSIAKTTCSFDHFDMLKRLNIPVVFFDRIPPRENIHYVACNMETGTIDAVTYLLKKGHRVIGLINGPKTLYASTERQEGYVKALVKNRLKFDPSLVVNCDLTEQSSIDVLQQLLNNKRKPTAIVTFNDYVCLFAMKYCRDNGLSDIDFVSYANLPLIHYMDNMPIASVEQYPALQAQKAADILLDLLSSPRKDPQEPEAYYRIVIESQLVENKR